MKKLIVSILSGLFIVGAGASSAAAGSLVVEKGDTLWGLAKENNTSVGELKSQNGLESDLIFPGQKLTINGDGEVSKSVYVVSHGDTLYKIAVANGVSVNNLKAWNGLTSNLIYPGQKLALQSTGNVEAAPKKAEKKAPAPEPKEEKTTKVKSATQNTSAAPEGQTLTVSATAYTAECAGCSGITYTGVDLNANRNAKVIAVDPNVIPLGSEVYVEGYGRAVAADIGGAINGYEVDLHVPTKSEAFDWGRRSVEVTILN